MTMPKNSLYFDVLFKTVLSLAKMKKQKRRPKLFLEKVFLKICSKFTGEHPATLLKLHFRMGVLLYIYCIFSEHLFLGAPLDGYFSGK